MSHPIVFCNTEVFIFRL